MALFVAGAVLLSAFFYPVWTGEIIPYQDWRFRMWTPYWLWGTVLATL